MKEHFEGCHPEDDHSPETPEGYIPQLTEECWHCGTSTERGTCFCWDCAGNGYIPPSAIHHCRTCGRWWAYMTGLNITEIIIPGIGS
jgi:hypothetical protein